MTSIDSGDLARRALHTFLQSFLAVLAVSYAASGLNVSQINDEASAKKFALAVVAAVVAAALSALKTTLVSLFTPATLGLNGSSGDGPVTDDGADADPAPVEQAPFVTGTAAPVAPHHPMPGPGRHEAAE